MGRTSDRLEHVSGTATNEGDAPTIAANSGVDALEVAADNEGKDYQEDATVFTVENKGNTLAIVANEKVTHAGSQRRKEVDARASAAAGTQQQDQQLQGAAAPARSRSTSQDQQ